MTTKARILLEKDNVLEAIADAISNCEFERGASMPADHPFWEAEIKKYEEFRARVEAWS